MILGVMLNPILTRYVWFDSFEMHKANRGSRKILTAGGKALNVARQLNHLGMTHLVTGFKGGHQGQSLEELIKQDSIRIDFVETKNETRSEIIAMVDEKFHTSLIEPSEKINPVEVELLREKIKFHLPKAQWLLLSGSTPQPELDTFYYEMTILAHEHQVPVVVDSTGDALKNVLMIKPTLVKPNINEFENSFGKKINSDLDAQQAVLFLLEQGIKYVVLSNGRNPFYIGRRYLPGYSSHHE
jgi:fructose-1-phosphate kinase PfkB-like protein